MKSSYFSSVFVAVPVAVFLTLSAGCSTSDDPGAAEPAARKQAVEPPRLTSVSPGSYANENHPVLHGWAQAGWTVTIYATPGCMGAARASEWPANSI